MSTTPTPTGAVPRLLVSPPVSSLDDHVARGGGIGLRRALEIGPEATTAELTGAGLRGRGGAGFPTGIKWRSVRGGGGRHHYAVCNAAEGEPGTFKDRALLRVNPYQVVEGLLIAAHTVGAIEGLIALKASFEPEVAAVRAALAEIEEAGWLGDVTVKVVTGPEEYLFGEEKALLEVIEGNEPLPRWLPPYLHGLYATAPQLGWQSAEPEAGHAPGHEANPTLVNNAESLAQATWILAHGADEFRTLGTESSPGTVVCTVVGDADAPGVIEVPMGTPLREVLARCGAPREGHQVKAVFPGVANAVVHGDQIDTPLTYEHFESAGSGLGAAGFIVYDDSACMVEVAAMLSRFLYVESCGQCPPCKLGSGHITEALERIRDGEGADADLDRIQERLRMVTDGNRCYLPVQERAVVSSVLRSYPEDVAAHLEGWCPSQRTEVPIPKVVDMADGKVTYDERQARKQPDWTYR
ncbi:MAG: NADH-ubiquinone oxidoreductase-F iron-sulfur binding region domain-containing protein [Acidimicrobiia bacterium]